MHRCLLDTEGEGGGEGVGIVFHINLYGEKGGSVALFQGSLEKPLSPL